MTHKEKIKASNELQDLLTDILDNYSKAWSEANTPRVAEFYISITNHKVPGDTKSSDIAYLRLGRTITTPATKDAEEETNDLLIYNCAYKFKNKKEQLNPEKPWYYYLYGNAMNALVCAGLEYAELRNRLNNGNNTKDGTGVPESNIRTVHNETEPTGPES